MKKLELYFNYLIGQEWVVTDPRGMYYSEPVGGKASSYAHVDKGFTFTLDILTTPLAVSYGVATAATNWIEYVCARAKPLLCTIEQLHMDLQREFFSTVMNFSAMFPLGFAIVHEKGFVKLDHGGATGNYVAMKPGRNGELLFNTTYSSEEALWLIKHGVDVLGLQKMGLAEYKQPTLFAQ